MASTIKYDFRDKSNYYRFKSVFVCLYYFSASRSEWFFFSLDGYVSVRPPTAVLARECFCPSQAENWPSSGAVQNTRGDASFPFLLFGGPRAPRGIIIITGSPIKLRGSSSAGEPPRCLHTHTHTHTRARALRERVYVHRHTGVETRGRASRELVLLSTTINAQGLSRCPTNDRARAPTSRCLNETHTDRRFIPSIMRFDRVGVRNNSRSGPSGFWGGSFLPSLSERKYN